MYCCFTTPGGEFGMRHLVYAIVFLCVFSISARVALGEDINAIFKRVNEFIAQKNFPKAIDELGWAKKEIEKLHLEKLKEFFADTLGDFRGDAFEMNSALGITNVQRRYVSNGASVTVSITGGSAAGQIGRASCRE